MSLSKIKNRSSFKEIILFILGFMLLSSISDFLISYLVDVEYTYSNYGFFEIIGIVIIVPIIETYIFQKVPIDFLLKKHLMPSWLIVVSTGVLFTLYHLNGLIESIPLFISGIYLSYMYIYLKRRNNLSFTATSFSHMLYNLFATLF
jgi:hypothetical protein